MSLQKLSLDEACNILLKQNLLREIIQNKSAQKHDDLTHENDQTWSIDASDFNGHSKPYSHITYDSRDIKPNTLLFIKGNFKPEYLKDADKNGLNAYVAQDCYAEYTNAVGLIVTDVRKAMSMLSAAFFNNPQEKLTTIGITGTKGKTTTAYFTHAILNAHSNGKAALFSSVDNCLDGKTYVESDLTTPESLDAFRMMSQAVENGMKYLVMEVSSQAYKVNRVYGLHFNVAAFLNISPDHISPIEHPTFEDYLYCKRQIVKNTDALVLNADCAHADLLLQDAKQNGVKVTTFSRIHKEELDGNTCNCTECSDYSDIHPYENSEKYPELVLPRYVAIPELQESQESDESQESQESQELPSSQEHCIAILEGEASEYVNQDMPNYSAIDKFNLKIAGDFNYENATAAIAIANALSINENTDQKALHAIENVQISGRMEVFKDTKSNTVAIVDYAHNYISTKSVVDFVYDKYGNNDLRITLVTGSTGDKAVDRRKEIVQAAQDRINQFVFTQEDTNVEDEMDICKYMQSCVTNPNVESRIIINRAEAIEYSVEEARKDARENNRLNIILAIGKGDERWIKVHNKHVPYEGDSFIIKRLFS
ncbi:UDP-N-acetylmuramoyl-L-alanyl-D-glutamate--2,6-diaminopimelate ligase [Bifidobacteriaceae bacterium N170]|uniref:UDP-N-acetylmuramoyl-L-alanyl-D-glutamate--2, 6-diaminopimelate ligase n=1 Tax=Gardnerella vaginalis TaxID=2702 RepID=UPI000E20E9AE|nr:UDP-N-acetylmuramoyl-L-alanyl-D-glutamate--2,6-diaminopimelate ligase [Gardnerella vaginalis]RDX00045.1 UDP-N-acetylmuramoylalanyl-D-glutamate--2,6-diaminopimelate ligase [Gardnerella vaginalis]RFT42816.1 UDP-N-acetylmuramoyl-L-alanyl-D-glutamate--2,6-diaminopimelate ligase [Bifidobacteriaceae bacterium N170]